MKVGDIRKLINDGRSEKIIISLIKRVKVPYKEFTLGDHCTMNKIHRSGN